MTIDRRVMLGATFAALAGGAALNAAVIVAAKAEAVKSCNVQHLPDPIFAALERYNCAHAFHSECLDRQGGDDGDDDLADVGSRAELDAIGALLRTVPTTAAGASTLVLFLLDEADKEYVTTLGASFGDDDTKRIPPVDRGVPRAAGGGVMTAPDIDLLNIVDDLGQIRRRVHALRLCAVAIEAEGDKRSGQGLREFVEIVSDDLSAVYEALDAARARQAEVKA